MYIGWGTGISPATKVIHTPYVRMKHLGEFKKMWLLLLVVWKCGKARCPQRPGRYVDRRAVHSQGYAHCGPQKGRYTAEFGDIGVVFHVSTAIHTQRREFCTRLCTPIHSVENARTAVDSPHSYAPPPRPERRRPSYPDVMDYFSTGYPQRCGQRRSRRVPPAPTRRVIYAGGVALPCVGSRRRRNGGPRRSLRAAMGLLPSRAGPARGSACEPPMSTS